jgi:CHAT domain-containing protein
MKSSQEELNWNPVGKFWPKYRYTIDNKNRFLAWHYHSMALTGENFGKFSDSIGYYKKAIETLNKIKEKEKKDYLISKSIFYEDLADLYGIIGKYTDALDYYDKVIEITKKVGGPQEISGDYFRAAILLLEAHKEEEAIKKFKESLNYLKDIKDPYSADTRKISTMNKIGEAYLRLGDLKKAKYYVTEAIKLEEKQDKPYYKNLYNLMSDIYLKEKNLQKALDYRLKSMLYRSTIDDLLCLSRIYLAMGKNKEALEYAEKALAEAKEKKTKWRLWNFYLEEGKILEDLGETERAIQIYKTSINIIEDTRNELKLEDYKRDFMKDKMEVYERLIKVLLKSGKEKEAFDYNERARARAFLDILANNRIDIHRGAPDNIIKKIDKLEDKIFYYSREDNRDDEILLKVKKEYEKIMEELKEKNPEYASLKSVSPLTTEKIQTLLDNDTAILEYFCGEEYLYIWIITEKKIFTKTVSVTSKELKEKIAFYREEISDNMTGEKLKLNEWQKKSRELYSILIGDMENLLQNKKRLYIVPHRTLHYLPFHTLCNSKGEVLVKNYEILYLPSATVLSYCREKHTLKKEQAAAFGYGNLNISPYPSLPGTIKEVEAIKKLYPHTNIYKEKKMTKNTVKISSEHADILHFATHGILDHQSPVFSKLILSDGDLHVYEIFDMKLSASLVTLSACRTGLGGEISEGDELTGFSRAFIYAGTPCVCVSLWDVSDKATGEFMEIFYLYLKENSRSKSLRLAQIDMMKKYGHPFIWAPFILIGD